VSEQVSYKRV